jgi:NAD+ synthase
MAAFLRIPEEIITKPPSAGLWPGQTDEEDLGLSYQDIDRYLLSGDASDPVSRRVESMISACHHKRQPPLLPEFLA